MEASNRISPGADRASPDSKAFEAMKARVVTRSFGVRFGAFGVDYTSKKVVLDQDGQQPGASGGGAAPTSQGGQAGKARERLLEEASYVSWRDAFSQQEQARAQGAQPGKSTHPNPVWRRGLDAYAKARNMLRAESIRATRTSLAVA